MWKLFSKNKTVQEDQQKLFFALEKIVNVALVKTEVGDNQSVKGILEDLEQIFRKFWQLKKDNPDKFESLLWSKDFFEKYVAPFEKKKDLIEEGSQEAKSAEELKSEAAFRLTFAADRELRGLTQFLTSFEKIWEHAFRNGNDEISRYVVYHLNWLLAELTREPSNNLFVEQFLILLNSIVWKVVRGSKSEKEINASVFSAGIDWYTSIVFGVLGRKGGGFDLSYLDLFDKYFFSTIKYIISENQTSLFHELVSSFVEGIHVPTYNEGKIWIYWSSILQSDPVKLKELDAKHEIQRRVKELAGSENNLDTIEKLNDWLKKFNELKEILQPHLEEKASKIEGEIKESAISQFKLNNLLEIVFAVGAYCLFKEKPDYIKYLWEYKQPPDSDASWIGLDIVPNTLNDAVSFYFRKGLLERKFDFWEEHHGSERYYKQYFLLLLARVLKNVPSTSEGKYEEIKNYNLPDLNIYRLSDLEHSIDGIVNVARELRKHEGVLQKLGFDRNDLDELFNDKLILFLQTLKVKAQERIQNIQRIQPISPKRVAEFKDKVVEAFYESAVMRHIFKYCKLCENRTKERYAGKLGRFGINLVDYKSSFFDEWHVHYHDWGTNMGRDLAHGENSYLLDEIAKNCVEIREEQFEEKLSIFDDFSDAIVFATNVALYRFFEKSEKFKPKWHKDTPQLDVKGFKGWYEFKGQSIPIFETYHRKAEKQILILNKSKLGWLVQHSPLNVGEDPLLLKDIFYMNIQVFSEKPELLDTFVKTPPEWLKKIGDEQKQRDHLQEKVLIHIFERFEYDRHKEFEGYFLRLKD